MTQNIRIEYTGMKIQGEVNDGTRVFVHRGKILMTVVDRPGPEWSELTGMAPELPELPESELPLLPPFDNRMEKFHWLQHYAGGQLEIAEWNPSLMRWYLPKSARAYAPSEMTSWLYVEPALTQSETLEATAVRAEGSGYAWSEDMARTLRMWKKALPA